MDNPRKYCHALALGEGREIVVRNTGCMLHLFAYTRFQPTITSLYLPFEKHVTGIVELNNVEMPDKYLVWSYQ